MDNILETIRDIQNSSTEPSWSVLFPQFYIRLPRSLEKTLDRVDEVVELGYSIEFAESVMLYPRSRRPICDMAIVTDRRELSQRTLQISRNNSMYIKIEAEEDSILCEEESGEYSGRYLIPVVRYAKGMSRGMYQESSQKEDEYCGTFYYFEPDSQFNLLSTKGILIANNKVEACLLLGISVDDIRNYLVPKYHNENNITKISDLPHELIPKILDFLGPDYYREDKDKILDPQELENYINRLLELIFLTWNFNEQSSNIKDFNNILLNYSENKQYNSKYYAIEDKLDQPLCLTARVLKINVIILKYMAGKNRVVTEVLDTRTRVESYDNISFPPLLHVHN
jgi:hypothetical protein